MTNPNCRVLIFSILRFISTKCCKTQNIPPLSLPYENPSRPSSDGLSIKQIFKELKSAGLRPDCLYIRLANSPSRSFS